MNDNIKKIIFGSLFCLILVIGVCFVGLNINTKGTRAIGTISEGMYRIPTSGYKETTFPSGITEGNPRTYSLDFVGVVNNVGTPYDTIKLFYEPNLQANQCPGVRYYVEFKNSATGEWERILSIKGDGTIDPNCSHYKEFDFIYLTNAQEVEDELYIWFTKNFETIKTFKITFDCNGVDCEWHSKEMLREANKEVSISAVAPVHPGGNEFLHWNTKADGSGDKISVGGSFVLTADITLYAIWKDDERQPLTMTFNANGGTLSGSDSKSCTPTDDNGCLVVGLPTATKSGYEFKGWNNKSSCVSGYYNQVRIKKDVTYYACWVKEVSDEDNISPIKITFDYNDGSGREEDASCVPSGKYGKCEVAFPNITHREYEEYGDEYKLLGWDTQDTCGQYTTDAVASVDQNLKYYACWKKVGSDNESSTGNDHSSSNNSPSSGGSSSDNQSSGGNLSNNNGSIDEDGNVTENSKTGDTAVILVLFASLIAVGYSVYYYKEIKS